MLKGEPPIGRNAIAAYRLKPGLTADLQLLMRKHFPILCSQGLVPGQPSSMMTARNGTIIEGFDWQSREEMGLAHCNPAVLRM